MENKSRPRYVTVIGIFGVIAGIIELITILVGRGAWGMYDYILMVSFFIFGIGLLRLINWVRIYSIIYLLFIIFLLVASMVDGWNKGYRKLDVEVVFIPILVAAVIYLNLPRIKEQFK